MESLLLQGKSKKEIEIITALAKLLGLKTQQFSKEELEDIGLANAMKKGRTKEYINVEGYVKKLRSK